MTKVQVDAIAISIPIDQPTRISTRILGARDYVIVRARNDGCPESGLGYVYAGTNGGRVLAAFVRECLAPLLEELDQVDPVSTWEAMFQETLLLGRRGLAIRAMSAIDIALWDLAAKAAALPLAKMLGGSVKPIPAYASGGYYRPLEGDWESAITREIKMNLEQGFSDHKIKVGGLSIEEDSNRVKAAVNAMAGRGRLALDANNAYKSVSEACRAISAFERAAGDVGIWWFEEPLSPEDIQGHALIRKRIDTPVATGELAQTRYEFQRLIEDEAADILQPDVGVVGGVTEYMRTVRTAETFGIAIAPHWHANMHVHLAAASSSCIAIEHFALEKDIYNFEKVIEPSHRLSVENGMAQMSDKPGLGIELDREALRKYSLDGEYLWAA